MFVVRTKKLLASWQICGLIDLGTREVKCGSRAGCLKLGYTSFGNTTVSDTRDGDRLGTFEVPSMRDLSENAAVGDVHVGITLTRECTTAGRLRGRGHRVDLDFVPIEIRSQEPFWGYLHGFRDSRIGWYQSGHWTKRVSASGEGNERTSVQTRQCNESNRGRLRLVGLTNY